MPNRAITFVIAALLLCISGASGLSDAISVRLDFNKPIISAQDQTLQRTSVQIDIPGYSLYISSGNPALPCKTIYVALPPDADENSINVTSNSYLTSTLSGSYDIAPVPPMAITDDTQIWGPGKTISEGRNLLVYNKDEFYPREHLRLVNVNRLRSWKIAELEFWPYSYNPVGGKLRVVDSNMASISYTRTSLAVASEPDPVADEMSGFIVNQDEAKQWYSSGMAVAGSLAGRYVIITTNAIAAASSKLADFVNFQTVRGYTVKIATEDDWGGGVGDVAANNIHNWLVNNYINLGTEYVLLIGDPNPTTGTVPMKMLWPRKNQSSYREAPSDYYYSALTGNWDKDGDTYMGEEPDDFGTGGIDRIPEVYVGRIPYYGSIQDVDSILQKTINYESTKYGVWIHNVLLPMKPLDTNTPCYYLGEAIRRDFVLPSGLTSTRIYDNTYGLNPAPEYYPCDYTPVQNEWQKGAGLVLWLTHGSSTTASSVFSSSRCANLDDTKPSIVYQGSCTNGMPEDISNLGYSLLLRGAASTLSASRVSWYYIGETSFTSSDSIGGLGYQYAKYIINRGESCGRAAYDARVNAPLSIWSNHLVYNLYGDPSLTFDKPVTGAISGKVLSTDGSPISEATVKTVDGAKSTLSLADGSYVLNGFRTGSQNIVVSAVGFYAQCYYSVPTTDGNISHLDFHLVSAVSGSIRGYIFDAMGQPVYNVLVTIPELGRSAYSLQDGGYSLLALTPGKYTLAISKATYASKNVYDCLVSEGASSRVDIVLESYTMNYLANGGFEAAFTNQVGTSWTNYTSSSYSASPLMGIDYIKYGAYSQKIHMPQPASVGHAGFYQSINVVPGRTYTLSAWQRNYFSGQETTSGDNIIGELGYDSAGGTNYASVGITWREFSTGHGTWYNASLDIVPSTNTITVFLDAWRKIPGGGDECYVWFDAASLVGPVDAPTVPAVKVNNSYQNDMASIYAEWSSADTDIDNYQYAISKTKDDSGIVPGGEWQSTGLNKSATRTGLSLVNGDSVRVLVKSTNKAGVSSEIGASGAIRIVSDVNSVSSAKLSPDGIWVRIRNLRVTRMGSGAECFVEDPNRSAGIKAIGSWLSIPYVTPGLKTDVVGSLSTQNGMRIIANAELMPSIMDTPLSPLGMINARVGGADYQYVAGPPSIGQVGSSWAKGLNNVGLLVSVWGKVISTVYDGFIISDGGLKDGLLIRCYNAATVPNPGAFVRVTGISTTDGVALYKSTDMTVLVP